MKHSDQRKLYVLLAVTVAVLATADLARPQGLSELYAEGENYGPAPQRMQTLVAAPGMQTDQRMLAPSVKSVSYFAVSRSAPQTYAIHDLVTIVIREDLSTDFSSDLETKKETKTNGAIKDFPKLRLADLLDLNIKGSAVDPDLKLDVEFNNEFTGEGDYKRRETMAARVTARVIDIKPNGTVVLEARKHIESDDETVTLVATGTCRVDDIAADNTVLSTRLYDLHVSKQHTGELHKSTKKGPLTKLLDAIFNF